MSAPTTPWRHLSATESFSAAGGKKWWQMGWKAAHMNKLYNILFVSPTWLLALLFFISWQGESSQSTTPFPRLGPTEDWKQFLLNMLSPGKREASVGRRRESGAASSSKRWWMKFRPSFRVDLQGGFINNNTIALSERKNPQPESSLEAISRLLPRWVRRGCSHIKHKQPPVEPRPTPLLRGIKITLLRIASNCCVYTQLVKIQDLNLSLKQKEEKVAK